MPEMALKELSDAAPPGPWSLSPQELDDWGMIRAALDPETGFRPVVCSIRSHDEAEQAAARQEGRQPKSVQARADFIIALERAYRAGHLHDATALATAVARARREALEEAAALVETEKMGWSATGRIVLNCAAIAIRALAATPPEARQTETGALADIAAERRRQVEAEGWTPEHDDAHGRFELASAASCYAVHAAYWHRDRVDSDNPPAWWPWDTTWWKPTNRRRDLVKSGALIVAEIERLDRASPPPAIGNLEGEPRS